MFDVIIIGAGVSGCCIARELSKYKLNILVLEKEEDVCSGTSKANSAIVHAGYDAHPGTLKAKLNLEGNLLMPQLAKDLSFDFINNGSMVVCVDKEDEDGLKELYDRGIENGVKGLKILNREEALKLEPNLADCVCSVLYAPTGGIVDPFGLTIATAENAYDNGVKFEFNKAVLDIEKLEDSFLIKTNNGEFDSKIIVNAAGLYSDEIHNLVSQKKLHINPRSGSYVLLDKLAGSHVKNTIFKLSGKKEIGKGVLVTPTTHGNLLVGPTADNLSDSDKGETYTIGDSIKTVIEKSKLNVKNIPYDQVITSFAGLRAVEDCDDFVIGEAPDAKGFIDCAGIQSPGLTSAPAIGVMVADIVAGILDPERKVDFISTRKGFTNPKELSSEEYDELIKKEPSFGRIVCRCEGISEGEILEAIRRPVGAKSMDGIKRRVRAGMGRCQAGFCTPKIIEILSRELGLDPEDIKKNSDGSELLFDRRRTEDALR